MVARVTVNTWDYTGYAWSDTGITLVVRQWCPIPINTAGSNHNVELVDGKVRIKTTGNYLVTTTYNVQNTVNAQPYYDMALFKNDVECANIIINNGRAGGVKFTCRYNMTNIFWFQTGDLLQPQIYSDLADICNAVDLNFVLLQE